MLKHQNISPKKPSRVVVLGASGFIGGATYRKIKSEAIDVLPLTRKEIDLLSQNASDKLADLINTNDTLVFASAKAPCKNMNMLVDNIRMACTVNEALQKKPVTHVIYISSDAVYKDTENHITEASCAEPNTLHGVMHLAREIALKQEYPRPLTIIRPTLVYGYDDPHNGYGPNRFSRLASAGEDIVLFGEGEERRDHVDVNDIAELIYLIAIHKSIGIANAVSGELVSFRQLADHAVASYNSMSNVITTKRNGQMPHNGYRPFNNSEVIKAFPQFKFKTWKEGLMNVHTRLRKDQKK